MADKGPDPGEEEKKREAVRGGKVVVNYRAVGNAPILIQKKFKINADESFQTIIDFLRRQLKLGVEDSLFVFVNSSFAPAPDELIRNLAECFHTNGTLIINYALTQAWG